MGIVSLGRLTSKHSTLNMSKDWNHGTFSCCDDMGTCCFSYWCGCCQIYNTAEDLGKSGCLYLLMSLCITPCVPIMLLWSLCPGPDCPGGEGPQRSIIRK